MTPNQVLSFLKEGKEKETEKVARMQKEGFAKEQWRAYYKRIRLARTNDNPPYPLNTGEGTYRQFT